MKRYFEFVPRRFESRLTFLHNMNQKVTIVGPQLGLTPAAITDLQDNLQFCIDILNDVNVKKTDLDQAIEARDLLDENQMKEIRRVVASMRKSPNFTSAIGAQLGIMASAVTIDTTEVKPLLKLKVVAGISRFRVERSSSTIAALLIPERHCSRGFNITKTSA